MPWHHVKLRLRWRNVTFDMCKVAAWLDTEGHLGQAGNAFRATIVQKEREPLEHYSQFVSSHFGLRCVVEKHNAYWQARHVASPKYLDSVEPFLETENKRRQIRKARQFYAERIFRRMFGIVKRGGRTRTTLTRETALLLWVERRKKKAVISELLAA